MPRRPDQLLFPVLALALAAAAVLLAGGGSGSSGPTPAPSAAGWRTLLGDRPAPLLGQRQIVVLKAASLADRVARVGGVASEEQMRAWTRTAREKQQVVLNRLAFKGAPISPEQSYVRVLNGFAASLDARSASLVERDAGVAGVYPVRAAYPAAADEEEGLAAGRRAGIELPGFDGAGITIALLDTGVDRTHPYLRERLLDGIDVVDPGGDATARLHPTVVGRQEQHGTELAGLIVGALGPVDLAGVAPGASLLPIRVAGWQPDATGGVAVYSRTDQLLAGIEAAVDPDESGDSHDAARVAVVGVAEPFAAFAEGPLAQAASGAATLDTLVVAPVGNDGLAGPSFGSASGPGGAPAALTVAAVDTRRESRSVHVFLRAGLGILLSGEQPLGGAFGPTKSDTLPVVVVQKGRVEASEGPRGASAFFGDRGYSVVAGTAPLLPRGATSPEAVRAAAVAGAGAILVDGPLPAGALSLDESVQVPILGIPSAVAKQIRAQRRAGTQVVVSIGAPKLKANPGAGAAAAFSSRGLGFDGGLKPELGAPGVGLATSAPGRMPGQGPRYGVVSGSSAAAAVAGAAAALLAQARPDLDAVALKSALIGSAVRLRGETGATGAGMVDVEAAAATEVVAVPGAIGLPPETPSTEESSMPLTLRSVSSRPLDVVLSVDRNAAGTLLRVTPGKIRLKPGKAVDVRVTVLPGTRPRPPSAMRGTIRIKPDDAPWTRVPWALALPVEGRPVLRDVKLSRKVFKSDGSQAVILSLVAGRVDGTVAKPQVLALSQLDIQLLRDGKRLGRLARVRNVLPGRYAFGLTGRDPAGNKLAEGIYELRVVGYPVSGAVGEARVSFTIR